MRVIGMVKWAGVAIIAMTVVVIAALHSIDVGRYRDAITAGVSKATGRDVSIGGEIELSLSLSPVVEVEALAIANADWGSRPRMMTLRRAEAQVELLPLITGDVRVAKLVLVEPDILLETNADDVPNWRFGTLSSGETAAVEVGADIDRTLGYREPARSGTSWMPVFNHVDIRQGRLRYRDGKTGREMRFELAEATIEAPSAIAPVTIEAVGAWNRAPFSMSGSIGPLSNLGAGLPLRLTGEVEVFGLDTRLSGAISEPHAMDGMDIAIEVVGSNLASLATVAGSSLPHPGPVHIEANVKGGAKKLEIDDFRLVLGSSDVSGTMTVAGIGGHPQVAGTLRSSRIDLAELLSGPEGGDSTAAGAPSESDQMKSGGVFPDDPLPLAGLTAVDLDLALAVDRLVTESLPLGEVKAGVLLQHGSMTVRPLSFSVAESRVDGELRLDAGRETPSVGIAVDATDLDLGALLKATDVSDLFEGRASISVDLAGTGASVAALAASLNGDIRMFAGGGRLETRTLDAAIGGARAVLGTFVAGKEQWTVVNCAVSSIGFNDGVATTRAMLIDTEYSTVAARGRIDLASETLALVVEPRAKSVTLNVAVPVHVQGTLANPTFRPEAGAMLRKLGGLIGLAVFPPAAIVGLIELGGGDNECMRIATTARDSDSISGSQSDPSVPATPASAVEEITDGAGELLEGASKGLKGFLGKGDEPGPPVGGSISRGSLERR